MAYDGKPTREWLSKEDSASPMVSLESLFLTLIIDAKEGQGMMTCNIPSASIHASIHASMPKIDKGCKKVIVKMTGILFELLPELAP